MSNGTLALYDLFEKSCVTDQSFNHHKKIGSTEVQVLKIASRMFRLGDARWSAGAIPCSTLSQFVEACVVSGWR